MAANQCTTPFPANQDRDAFGNWLGGFTAGEGSFILCWTKGGKTANKKTGAAKFVISLRDDDRAIIEEIHAFLGCGTIHDRLREGDNPQCRIVVSRAEDLVGTVIPLFERYPIRAKKQRDFPIWRRGVELVYRVSSRPMTGAGKGFRTKWTARDVSEFAAITAHLNGQREYDSPVLTLPPVPPPAPKPLLLFDID